MKKKLVGIVFAVLLTTSAVFAQGGVPTGGVKQCPPNTICPQSTAPEIPWHVDLVTFVLSIV